MENSSPSPTSQNSPTQSAESFSVGASMLGCIGMIGLVVVILFIAVGAFLSLHNGDQSALRREQIPFGIAVQGIVDVLVVVYLVIMLPQIAKTSLYSLGFRAPTAREIAIALAGAVAMIVVVNGLGTIIDSVLHTKHQQEAVKMLLSTHDPTVKAGLAILAVFVAPVAEEMAFRVFLFNAVRRYWGFWGGAIVSGIFFGIAHADVYALVPLILGGIILCFVYARSRNAWMSMITHGIFNAVSVIALFFAPQLTR